MGTQKKKKKKRKSRKKKKRRIRSRKKKKKKKKKKKIFYFVFCSCKSLYSLCDRTFSCADWTSLVAVVLKSTVSISFYFHL